MKPKRNAFAALGWLAWKALAAIGLPYAKNKIRGDRGSRT